MMTKMIFYMVLIGICLFLFISSARLLGLNITIFRSPECNYNCVCEDFEKGSNCGDCEIEFSDTTCEEKEMEYIVKNLCNHAWCYQRCETLWYELVEYYGTDEERFKDTLYKYNESFCCLIFNLPRILKNNYICRGKHVITSTGG